MASLNRARAALFALTAAYIALSHQSLSAAAVCAFLAGYVVYAGSFSVRLPGLLVELVLVNYTVISVGPSLTLLYLPSMALACAQFRTPGALVGGLLIGLASASLYTGASLALTGLLLCELTALQNRGQQGEYDRRARQARRESSDRLHARELQIAWEVQKALLPREAPDMAGWQINFEVWPARTVGGDLIQFFRQGDRLGCVVADVSGKGVPAAIIVGGLHQLLHRVGHLPLEDSMAEINRSISASAPDGFSVALVFLWVDTSTGDVQWVNAGSPHPLCRRASSQVEAWPSSDPCAGWDDACQFTVHRGRLEPGDTLLIFTDGLPDVETEPGQRHGEDRIVEVLRHNSTKLLKPALRDLAHSGVRTDDITFVALHRQA